MHVSTINGLSVNSIRFVHKLFISGARGEALRYKPGGRGFDPRYIFGIFSLT